MNKFMLIILIFLFIGLPVQAQQITEHVAFPTNDVKISQGEL